MFFPKLPDAEHTTVLLVETSAPLRFPNSYSTSCELQGRRSVRYYEHGIGVKLDKKKAMQLCRMAADRGDAVAQSILAKLLHSEEKFEEAVRYFVLAANQGYTYGEHGLGVCYGNGQGTEVDLGKARCWFERAAAKGHQKAVQNLAGLDARV